MASMNDRSLSRLIAADFAAQVFLALCVGLAASVVLGATAMLLAGAA
jgi:hypothetical protein